MKKEPLRLESQEDPTPAQAPKQQRLALDLKWSELKPSRPKQAPIADLDLFDL